MGYKTTLQFAENVFANGADTTHFCYNKTARTAKRPPASPAFGRTCFLAATLYPSTFNIFRSCEKIYPFG